MQISCEHCGERVPVGDLNLATMVARCRHCDQLFSLAERLPAVPEGKPLRIVDREKVELPPGFELERRGKDLRIRRSWFQWSVLPLGFFALVWNGFMVFWFGLAIASGAWPMLFFGSLHAAVGLAMAYGTLAGLVGSTTVTVRGGRLGIRHGPMPWMGCRDLAVGEIDQLYVKRKNPGDGDTELFELHAVLANRCHLLLLDSIPDSAQALFLEQELEEFLGIEDWPVPGELPRASQAPALRDGRDHRRIPSPSTRALPSGATGAMELPEPLPEGALLVTTLLRGDRSRCPVCGEPVTGRAIICERCETPHHEECWRYSDGCATYACKH